MIHVLRNTILFSIVLAPFHTLSIGKQGLQFLLILTFDSYHPNGWDVVSPCGFDLRYPKDWWCWASFLPLWAICLSLEKCLPKTLFILKSDSDCFSASFHWSVNTRIPNEQIRNNKTNDFFQRENICVTITHINVIKYYKHTEIPLTVLTFSPRQPLFWPQAPLIHFACLWTLYKWKHCVWLLSLNIRFIRLSHTVACSDNSCCLTI